MRLARGSLVVGTWMLSVGAQAQPQALPQPQEVGSIPDQSPHEEYVLGRQLFWGASALRGRLYTHVADLPPTVVTCANCHAVADSPTVPGSVAPRLTHDLLLRPRSRRGGPPSNYDRAGFCTLLRQGVDPAHVVIDVQMPRYTLSEPACRALWRYLIDSGHDDATH